MRQRIATYRGVGLAMLVMTLMGMGVAYAQDPGKGATSYAPVAIKEDFASIMARMTAAKSEIMKRQIDLLNERYDLSDRPAQGVTMSRGKAVQEGGMLFPKFQIDEMWFYKPRMINGRMAAADGPIKTL